jgi:hypothetical protein
LELSVSWRLRFDFDLLPFWLGGRMMALVGVLDAPVPVPDSEEKR